MGEAEVIFRVIWEDLALLDLDRIWLTAVDREGIENVAVRINTELTHNPLEAGESRDDNTRLLFKYPLIIWFRVVERLNEVHILHIRLTRRGQ